MIREHSSDRQEMADVVHMIPLVQVTTVQHYACQMLRQSGFSGGGFSVWSDEQALGVIRSLWETALGKGSPGPGAAEEFYTWHCKNSRLTRIERAIPASHEFWPTLEEQYIDEKTRSRALDPHDLVPAALHQLEEPARTAGMVAGLNSLHVLVDHFHDVTLQEFLLLKALAGEPRSIAAGYDPVQMVRDGALPNLMERFLLEYRRALEVSLPVTHRPTSELAQSIVRLSTNAADHSFKGRRQYRFFSPRNGRQTTVTSVEGRPEAEARYISRLLSNGLGHPAHRADDTAIIYQRGATAMDWVATQLAAEDIQFNVDQGLLRRNARGRGGPSRELGPPSSDPYSDAERVLAVLRCCVNPYDQVAFGDALSAGSRPSGGHPSDDDLVQIAEISCDRDINLVDAARHYIQGINAQKGRYRAIAPVIEALARLEGALEHGDQPGLEGVVDVAVDAICRAREGLVPSPCLRPHYG